MWIEGILVLHIVDTHTKFQNLAVLTKVRPSDICASFMTLVYCGYPMALQLDQQSGFTSKAIRDKGTSENIELQFSGPQSHNTLPSKEAYHKPLRGVSKVLFEHHPSV